MAKMKPATTADVREWARETDWKDENERSVADRGRMPSSLITAFNKAKKRERIEYVNGGRVVGEQSGTTPSVPAPRTSTEKATSASKAAPARRESNTSQKTTAAPQAMVMQGAPDGVASMIDALTAAAKNSKQGGTPILFSASTLVTV